MRDDRQSAKPAYLTVEDVARDQQHHPKTVRRWIKTGTLPALRINRQYRIAPEAYASFLAARRYAPFSDE